MHPKTFGIQVELSTITANGLKLYMEASPQPTKNVQELSILLVASGL